MGIADNLNDMLNDVMPNMNRDEFNSIDQNSKKAVCSHCLRAYRASGDNLGSVLSAFPICSACSDKDPHTGQSIFDMLSSAYTQRSQNTQSSQTHTQSYRNDQARGRQDYVESATERKRKQEQQEEDRLRYLRKEANSAREKIAREAERKRRDKYYEYFRRQGAAQETAERQRRKQESASMFSTKECPPYGSFCYELLGISNDEYTPDRRTVKKAYRRKALQTHPDRGGNPEKFKIINNAYRTIVDKYD